MPVPNGLMWSRFGDQVGKAAIVAKAREQSTPTCRRARGGGLGSIIERGARPSCTAAAAGAFSGAVVGGDGFGLGRKLE